MYFEFQVYLFNNGRDNYDKILQFLYDNDDNKDNAKAIAIPWVFSENSRAIKRHQICLITKGKCINSLPHNHDF